MKKTRWKVWRAVGLDCGDAFRDGRMIGGVTREAGQKVWAADRCTVLQECARGTLVQWEPRRYYARRCQAKRFVEGGL